MPLFLFAWCVNVCVTIACRLYFIILSVLMSVGDKTKRGRGKERREQSSKEKQKEREERERGRERSRNTKLWREVGERYKKIVRKNDIKVEKK